MYAQFRAEAEAPGAQRIAADALCIVNGCGDSIDWRLEVCNARNQDELWAKIQEFLLLALNSQIKLKVDGAKHEPLHFGVRKRTRVPESPCGLDQRQNGRCGAAMLGHGANVLGVFRLGQEHSRHALLFAQRKVFPKPFSLLPLHPDYHSVFPLTPSPQTPPPPPLT